MYRISEIDEHIRRSRTYSEALVLWLLERKSFPAPRLYYANISDSYLIMEFIRGTLLKKLINKIDIEYIEKIGHYIGEMIAFLHNIGIVHNDLTTSNFIVKNNNLNTIYLIDYGLSMRSTNFKDKAVDIDVFKRVLTSSHPDIFEPLFSSFIEAYQKNAQDSESIIKFYNKLSKMGRYSQR